MLLTIIVTIGVILVVVAVTLAAVEYLRRQRPWTTRQVGRQMIVHSADGSIQGVVIERAVDGLVLDAAQHLGTREKIHGRMFVPWSQVLYVQVS